MIKQRDGLTYINCGDWVDSCTAIVEHLDGRMELIHWKGSATIVQNDTAQNAAQICDELMQKSSAGNEVLHV
jgi:hypothetical protein